MSEEQPPSSKRKRLEDDTLATTTSSRNKPSTTPPLVATDADPDTADDDDEIKWSEEIHRAFVTAIYDAGVAQSSPSVILENMAHRPASLTSERVKSHLQKYRKNKMKSKEDFVHDYDSFMRKAVTVGSAGSINGASANASSGIGGAGAGASHVIMPPAAMMEMMGGGKPSGGDIAAFLSYSVMTEGETKNTAGVTMSPIGIQKESQDYLKNFAGNHLPFPQLTEEEKQSPLGVSMVYVMGLFSSLSQHMMNERRNNPELITATSSSEQQQQQQQMTAESSSSMPPPLPANTTASNTNSIASHGKYTITQQPTYVMDINNGNNNMSGKYIQATGFLQPQSNQHQEQQNSYWRNGNAQQLNNSNNGGLGASVNNINHSNNNGVIHHAATSAASALGGTNWNVVRQSAGVPTAAAVSPGSSSLSTQLMPSNNGVGGGAAPPKPGTYAQV